MIRGIVFDLDGTLVDSRLDFAQMRADMDLPPGQPILEAIELLAAAEAERCRGILHRHELAGAERATLLPGVAPLWAELEQRGVALAIATRNSRRIAEATLARIGLAVELLLTRDDGPIKPAPWPVLFACQQWRFEPREVAMIGDYVFDIECGRAAGSRTVLLTETHDLAAEAQSIGADLVLHSLADYPRLLDWLKSL
jgi:HAD superfamily hydrolase (TIGR01509 family)